MLHKLILFCTVLFLLYCKSKSTIIFPQINSVTICATQYGTHGFPLRSKAGEKQSHTHVLWITWIRGQWGKWYSVAYWQFHNWTHKSACMINRLFQQKGLGSLCTHVVWCPRHSYFEMNIPLPSSHCCLSARPQTMVQRHTAAGL